MTASAARGVEGLDGRRFDALVIGGGILGAGVAAALAGHGFSCLLVERADFGQGTTARSTRLIHGGLRYLAMFDFGLVREGLRERGWQLAELPHLVRPLGIVLPHYNDPLWQRARIRLGLTLYDLLSPRGSLPRHRHLSRNAVVELESGLRDDGLQGAELFWDGQAELPERLVIEILRRAAALGAEARNYVAAVGLQRTAGRVVGAELLDLGTREQAVISVGTVVNATGPWADVTLRDLGIDRPPLLRLSQGVHLIYPVLAGHAVAVQHPRDGRLCFVIPWQGMTMVGTTDTDVDGPPEVARVRAQDVDYLAELVEHHFSAAARPMWGSVGVRSLSRGVGRRALPQSVSRRHVLVDHAADGADGLFTLAGGKLTTWRATGEYVFRRLASALPRPAHSPPRRVEEPPRAREIDVPDRLWRLYGVRSADLRSWIDADSWWGEPIMPGSDVLRAEIAHALEREWAVSLTDVVMRRLALGFGADLGVGAAGAVGAVCRSRFGWTEERVERELTDFNTQNRERRLPEGGAIQHVAA